MIRLVVTCIVVINCVSCDSSSHILQAVTVTGNDEPHIGTFDNSAPTEAVFHITWDPDPLEKGQYVVIEGNYTFPEDFVSGMMDVKCGSIFSDKYPLKCENIWNKPCKKGVTAYRKKKMPVPSVVPSGISFLLTAKLTNNKTGHEIMCVKGVIRVARDKQ